MCWCNRFINGYFSIKLSELLPTSQKCGCYNATLGLRREKKENERERERDREKNGTKERNKYTLSHIPQIPWPVTCTLHSKQSLSALLLNMSIKVREGGKLLKLARRLGGVSSFGIYSNSTVLAFLIYYIQSVLNVILKICVLCITILIA